MKKSYLIRGVVLGLLLLGTNASRAQDSLPSVRRIHFPYSATLHPRATLTVNNPNGSVTIRAVRGAKVKVDAFLTVRGVDERSAADGIARTILATGGDPSNRWFRVDGR